MPQLNPVQRGRTASLIQIRLLTLIDNGVGNEDLLQQYKAQYGFQADEGNLLNVIWIMRKRGWLRSFREKNERSVHILTPQGALVLLDAKWKLTRALGLTTYKKPERTPANWLTR